MYDNNFEKFPSSNIENTNERPVPEEQDFAKAFESGVPEFAGNQIDQTSKDEDPIINESETEDANYDSGLADAAALINYGLDAASRELGVERTIQLIKSFDATGSESPIKDLYDHLGIDTTEERKDVAFEARATRFKENEFREESGIPTTARRSKEGAFKAIADMKELISEVEGADPRYAKLRAGAKAAGKGYFDYAVKDFGTQGLTELFSVLAEQGEEPAEGITEATTDTEVAENLPVSDMPPIESKTQSLDKPYES